MKNFLSELLWRIGSRLIMWSAALEPKETHVGNDIYRYYVGYRFSENGEVVVPNQSVKVEDRS